MIISKNYEFLNRKKARVKNGVVSEYDDKSSIIIKQYLMSGRCYELDC